jgi:hypothetical protein
MRKWRTGKPHDEQARARMREAQRSHVRADSWTAEQDEAVRTMRPKDAAETTVRTLQAVWARRRVLGLPDGRRNWTAEDDEHVRALPAKEAAQRLGRTLKAVYERRRALGLPDGRAR